MDKKRETTGSLKYKYFLLAILSFADDSGQVRVSYTSLCDKLMRYKIIRYKYELKVLLFSFQKKEHGVFQFVLMPQKTIHIQIKSPDKILNELNLLPTLPYTYEKAKEILVFLKDRIDSGEIENAKTFYDL